jgi:hypothetical protein
VTVSTSSQKYAIMNCRPVNDKTRVKHGEIRSQSMRRVRLDSGKQQQKRHGAISPMTVLAGQVSSQQAELYVNETQNEAEFSLGGKSTGCDCTTICELTSSAKQRCQVTL